jgi:hypothetical protein
MEEKIINITSGPNREDLFDGQRLFAEKRTVPFTVEINDKEFTLRVIMAGIKPEDGSGRSWNLEFVITVHDLIGAEISPEINKMLSGKKHIAVTAYYSTHRRKGTITFKTEN